METPSLEQIWAKSQEHFKSDADFQTEFRAFMEECKPMLETFKNKKIARMVLDEDTNTLYIYAKKALTITALLSVVVGAIKWLITK